MLKWKALSIVLLAPLLGVAQQTSPPNSSAVVSHTTGAEVAKHEIQLGNQLRETGDVDGALQHFRAAVDAAPEMFEAHEAFAYEMQAAQAAKLRGGSHELSDILAANAAAGKPVAALYEQWAREHPENVIYRYFAVRFRHAWYDAADIPDYKRMTETDPNFAPPYDELSVFASMQGDDAAFLKYELKAAELRPDDIGYRTRYVNYFFENEPEKYPPLAEDFARRFPKDATEALMNAAEVVKTPQEKAHYLERALAVAPEYSRAMIAGQLCAVYEAFDPRKAVDLAAKELRDARNNASIHKSALKQYEEFNVHYSAFAQAQQLFTAGKLDEAAAASEKIQPIKLSQFAKNDPFVLAKLRSDIFAAQGKYQQAYDVFLAAAAPAPSTKFLDALVPLAEKVHKNTTQVHADILAAVRADARRLPDFEFPDFAGGTRNSAEARGKILYINLWAPS